MMYKIKQKIIKKWNAFLYLFKWRLRLVQQGYDLGWGHGFEAGELEKYHEIIDVLTYNIETIDWLKETPIEVRDVVNIVKNHKNTKKTIEW